MAIDFSPQRWDRIRDTYRRWWAGELKRPLIQLTLTGRDPGRSEPKLPYYGNAAHYAPSVSPEAIVDRLDYELSRKEYLGDAFPTTWASFGPGVVAAFLGAKVSTSPETTWFLPPDDRDIRDLSLKYVPDSPWLRRIKDVSRAAVERWKGRVQLSMTDLGGAVDVVSAFRPGEALLLDLYDHPSEVQRLTWEVHEAWWRYFEEIHEILRPGNPGYTAWAPILSEEPYYMFQCDFSYMIGPEMFDEFVKPELAASCRRIPHAFYHLDGAGQLPHLDSLLAIPELKGVQWIPGSGAKPQSQWPEVYRKIRKAGKLVQVYAYSDPQTPGLDFHWLDTLVDQLGGTEGIVMLAATAPMERKKEALAFLEKYGAA